MKSFNLKEHTHKRYNPLTGEWVLVTPHRNKRPWKGKEETNVIDSRPEYEKNCYLCPGNVRANGERNPDYTKTFVFDNDFPALQCNEPQGNYELQTLLKAKSERGICRVICFSPYHNLTLAELSTTDVLQVVETWNEEYYNLGSKDLIRYVQIFENKGSIMGCSNPHPHGQIWAQESLPGEIEKETNTQINYFYKNKESLLSKYLQIEMEKKERIVLENDSFVALVPFWAIWPFETMIISKTHRRNINEFTSPEKKDLAETLKILTTKYDNLFHTSFPYSSGIHQSPTDDKKHNEWHFHIHFYPPLLRSATIKKFMVGYEMLANPQRDFTPEFSAQKLRELSINHYKSI